MKSISLFLFAILSCWIHQMGLSFLLANPSVMPSSSSSWKTTLHSGVGIAEDYRWHEEAFEIEVTVEVPKETKAKDISFKATPTSVELKLTPDNKILLDPSRALRGKIVVDGTYWVISDSETDSNKRQVTVTIEKQIRQAKDDFDVVDYDWNGVYREEREGEVTHRKYGEPEELDVREYAASLGVDIDNINMSMVDKTMFSSGLNLTKSSYDSLRESGLMQEVTQQGDGSEWITNDDGEQIPFDSGMASDSTSKKSGVPFLDTDSPWHKAVKIEERDEVDTETAKQEFEKKQKKKELQRQRQREAADPIATLTVSKLKEILRLRGLKVSGNKQELQDRLRAEVNSMMQLEDEDVSEKNDDNVED